MDESAVTQKYSAFISYSRADERFAARLERVLERYLIPRALRRRQRRLCVFRDVHDAVVGELSEVLETALDDSEHLIVVCSPAARASEYVAQEIAYFARNNGASCILPVLVAGRPNPEVSADDPVQDQAFPEALSELFQTPLAADFRPRPADGFFARRARLSEARFQVIARLLQTDKSEELVGRERRKRRTVGALLGGVAAILIAAAGLWVYDNIPKPGIGLGRLPDDQPWAERARSRIETMRQAAVQELPDRRDRDVLVIATWNAGDFGRGRIRGGPIGAEAIRYAAEIISYFDIVALQELSGSSREFDPVFDELRGALGGHWQAVLSGVTEGRRGNAERLGFLYDARKVRFTDFADEVVLSEAHLEASGLARQIARTPFIGEFEWNGLRILLCNVHIWFGSAGDSQAVERRQEVQAIAGYLSAAMDAERLSGEVLVLLGDLNAPRANDPTLEALRGAGFVAPLGLQALGTNAALDRPYDQILWRRRADGGLVPVGGGVFDFFRFVYGEEDQEAYADAWRPVYEARDPDGRRDPAIFYRNWRRTELSDHVPKWLALGLGPDDG